MRQISLGSALTVCLLTTVAAMPAYAGPLCKPDPSRLLTDPAYLPMKGQVYGSTGYSYGFSRTVAYNASTGSKTSSSNIHTQTIKQEAAYGLTDAFILRADVSYLPQNKVSTDSIGAGTSIRNNNGFTNPNFGVTYRVLDQMKTSPVSVDLIADYAPDLIDAERASSNSVDGNVARGGDFANLGTQVSYKTGLFTVAGLGGVNYSGEREIQAKNTGTITDADNFWTAYVGVDTQTRLTERFSLDLGARYNVPTSAEQTNLASNITNKRNNGNYGTLSFGLNYQILPNRLAANLSYDYNSYEDTKTGFVNPASDNRVATTASSIFGVRLQYAY